MHPVQSNSRKCYARDDLCFEDILPLLYDQRVFDLKGASFTLGTACSSSLVALHQGCQSLRSGDAKLSIVGGCNLLLNPDTYVSNAFKHTISCARWAM